MERIGVVDLGSNSVRLVVVEITANGAYRWINDVKASTRLSRGLQPDGTLQGPIVEETLRVLGRFAHICQVSGVDTILAVATAAVRSAQNAAEFLGRVEAETGWRVRLLTGMEEAFYDFLGVSQTFTLADGLIIDIGGGSTELVLFRDRTMEAAACIPFGAVNSTDRYSAADELDFRLIMESIGKELDIVPWLDDAAGLPLIGVGGTIRNLARIDRKQRDYTFDLTHGYEMAPDNVRYIAQMLSELSLQDRYQVPGLSRERAEVIVGGSAIAAVVTERSRCNTVLISGNGLREGLVFEHLAFPALRENHRELSVDLHPIQWHSVINNMRLFGVPMEHSHFVCQLALTLFDTLQRHGGVTPAERLPLILAALLHDAGTMINYYDHHKHTFYMISNARWYGFRHRDIVLAAYIAASHGHKTYTKGFDAFSHLLDQNDKAAVRMLGALLSLAEALDHGEMGDAAGMRVEIVNDAIRIWLSAAAWAACNPYEVISSGENLGEYLNMRFSVETDTL